jgi:hypothetical protein
LCNVFTIDVVPASASGNTSKSERFPAHYAIARRTRSRGRRRAMALGSDRTRDESTFVAGTRDERDEYGEE